MVVPAEAMTPIRAATYKAVVKSGVVLSILLSPYSIAAPTVSLSWARAYLPIMREADLTSEDIPYNQREQTQEN